MVETLPRHAPELDVDDAGRHDHIVTLRGATWADYQRALEIRGERSVPRISYLEGNLEFKSPSRYHETIASVIGRLVEAWCMDRGIDLTPVGSWTIENKEKEAGLEPDECYVFGDRDDIDDWEKPDLAIEVVWTSGGLSKLAIYRKLGIREVWTWKKKKIHVHELVGDAYEPRETSVTLPDIDLELIARLAEVRPMTRALRELRASAPPA